MGIRESKYNNIVAWWDLGRGTLKDFSPNGHDFTDTGDPHFINVDKRKGIEFNPNDVLTATDAADLSFGDGSNDEAFTISAWVRPGGVGTSVIPLSKGVLNTDAEYSLSLLTFGSSQGALSLYVFDESVASCYLSRKYAANLHTNYTDKWIHIVGVYDGTGGTTQDASIKLYLNGVRVDGTNNGGSQGSYVAMEPLAGDVWMGRYITAYSTGAIGETILFNEELSAAEVAQLYEESVGEISSVSTPEIFTIPDKTRLSEAGAFETWDFKDFEGETVKSRYDAGTDLTQTAGRMIRRKNPLGFVGFFDNTNYLTGTSSAGYYDSLSTAFTASAWIKTSTNSVQGVISTTAADGKRNGFLTDSLSKIRLAYNGFYYRQSGAVPDYSDGKWHYVIVSADSSNKYIYVDGTSYDTNDTSSLASSTVNTARIGNLIPSTFTFSGEMCNHKIWNRSFTPDELTNISNIELSRPLLYDNLDQANVSTQTSIASGFLENTRWTVATGTFKISDEADTGKKRIECVTNGTITTNIKLDDYLGSGYLKILSGDLSGDEGGTITAGSSTAYAGEILTITMTAGQVINEIMITVGAAV